MNEQAYTEKLEHRKKEFSEIIEHVEDLRILEYLICLSKLILQKWGR